MTGEAIGMDRGLSGLDAEAARVDAMLAPPPPEPDQAAQAEEHQAAADRQQEAGLIVCIVRPMLETAFPCLKGVEEARAEPTPIQEAEWQALAGPIAELLEYYNIDMGGYLSSPWAKLALSAAPLAMHGLSNYMAAAEKQAAQPAKAITDTGSPGEPVPGAPDPATFIQRG